MRNLSEIYDLLDQLQSVTAHELEDQDLDFKEWDTKSVENSLKLVAKMAICMANGGGGTVIFGVHDKKKGRAEAIIGVPVEIDQNQIKKAVYDMTDPKITPVIEELRVPEGTGRILAMQIYPGIPPYTDTSGKGTIRVGVDCQPLTGTMRRKISIETGETDFTADPIPDNPADLISPTAMEILRHQAKLEKVPEDLISLSDMDLLHSLGLILKGHLTRAGLLLAGKQEIIKSYFPGYAWTWLRMLSDTNYTNRFDGHEALPVALDHIERLINADNPITTLQQGLFHFEYRCYPIIALREALLNAFCHADYRLNAPIVIKQYPDRLEINNPGGFIGGITASNILHHQPVPRNPRLVDALLKLRLVNRSNLGISRMYEALLIEGKEPPLISDSGESVSVTFYHRDFSSKFRMFIEEGEKSGHVFSVDTLIILHYLLHHPEADTHLLSVQVHRNETRTFDLLNRMEQKGLLERGGTGKGTYWALSSKIYKQLTTEGTSERSRRIDWDAAKTRVLSVLKERAKKREPGLKSEDIRQITHYDRNQVTRLMKELRQEDSNIQAPGKGRHATYIYKI